MAAPPNVEMEAAKFLHQLIQDSKDEPSKLATKLYVILQHMRASGKENSMPYQVISRAMETVIGQHGLDIESLMSSRPPLNAGGQGVDSASSQQGGSSVRGAIAKEANANMSSSELSKVDGYTSNQPSAGRSSAVSQLNSTAGKVYGTASSGLGPYAAAEPGLPSSAQFGSFDNHGLARNERSMEAFSVTPSVEGTLGKGIILNSVTERGTLINNGKSPIAQSSTASCMPFKDQHLKQLRAQCLVYLAFRNGLMPKKLHLDIALGNILPKEDGPSKEMIDQKGKEQSVDGPSSTPDMTIPFERLDNPRDVERSHLGSLSNTMIADGSLSREDGSMNMVGDKNGVPLMKSEVTGSAGNGCNDEFVPMPERNDGALSQSSRLGDHNFQGSQHADAYLPSYPLREQQKPLSRMDGGNHLDSQAKVSHKSSAGSKMVPVDNALLNANPFTVVETDQEEDNISVSTDLPPSAKYTTTEKWVREQQKRKLLGDQRWALKQQKTNQRINKCVDELKDNVSASGDISTKTKSVIELKKLQLLELQNRLRNDILNDFFKPITSDMERLKSIKKHRIGRRSKQHERYEQKMKEERQKRFRERQKEFFSEIEAHKERVEDISKMRRERWKGFNRYAREFHKKKERAHREKNDRIQREKINLLKVNDVEGYLRMVQDAKSDRVKQLLKETEKYLQKLGSKLKDAKVMSRCFGSETDDYRSAGVMEKIEITAENEDETDQAKHYLESNEKYYLMAHSIKENVAEQPTCLVGGKLREYQMNGLRWLVSLYNNHLNGILADEMGLGKTVQVISLICYLMETKNDRGPFLVVVPSSVLPGWDSEINFWAPSINKIVYSGPPEERRRLFKERIVPQKFNVLLTTYEYLMNKHDRPKLSKIHWHYVIIDEGHRIKNASCKLNADLKLYRSSHRLLLTGTPLQNNLEELWALLNFLLPNIFNSSEDFSQWFNKPFESNGDSTADEALLSEEENLLIINRLHQVLRPFVLRRLKHKVENELPEKIERLVRCEASAYQKLLMKRVEDNLGALGTSKARSVHNSVMELRNICNHPYLSQLHSEEVHEFIPKHYLPNVVRLCGKLEMLDRILPKLKATNHRVLLFSTMTRLLDVMEDYLYWKQYKYLRLDGHTCGGDRGALIDQFNKPGSSYFIFLLSIRAGGVGVNLQAADTVIIFDTDWNPQVDLQAQARAHRIGQKREVLVLRFETVQTVEEQVRAAAEHKLGVANQSITAGFFDNNTSAEDRREYLESLLRESKKEEAAPVLHDDALNDLIARSESEIDIFESVDRIRQEEEMAAWKLALGNGENTSEPVFSLPSRLVTDNELKEFSDAMKIFDAPAPVAVSNLGVKRKSQSLGGLDTQHYGRGKRAREVRSYEEQWTEDEFEKICQVESPQSPTKLKDKVKEMMLPVVAGESSKITTKSEAIVSSCTAPQSPKSSVQSPFLQSVQTTPIQLAQPSTMQSVQPPQLQSAKSLVQSAGPPPPVASAQHSFVQSAQPPLQQPVQLSLPQPVQSPMLNLPQRSKEVTPPSKRGRGRPKKANPQIPPSQMGVPAPSGASNMDVGSQRGIVLTNPVVAGPDALTSSSSLRNTTETIHQLGISSTPGSQAIASLPPTSNILSTPIPEKRRGRKAKSGGETPRRGRKPSTSLSPTPVHPILSSTNNSAMRSQDEIVSSSPFSQGPDTVSQLIPAKDVGKEATTASLVPVHLPASSTIKLNTESEVTTVSSSCTLSSASILTETVGPSRNLHVEGDGSHPMSSLIHVPCESQTITVGTVSSSQPNLPFPSVPLLQSVPLPQSIPKQVKGRGSRAKSEVEAPRRKGRKRDAVSTVVPDKSGDQEPVEQPVKKSRVSAGKKSVVMRSNPPNEAQNLMNVIHAYAHTSLGFTGLDPVVPRESYQSAETKKEINSSGHVATRSTDKESSQTKANQFDETISGDGILSDNIEVCQTSEGPVGKQIQNAGENDFSATIKEITGDNSQSSQIEICQELSDEQVVELGGVSKPSFIDVSLAQSSDSKTEMPLSGTAPVSNLPIEVCVPQSGKEGGENVQELINYPSRVIVPSELGYSGSGNKRKVDVLFANTTISEQFTDTKVVGVSDLPGLVCSGTDTGVTGCQSLEERKCSALLASETKTITHSSDDNSKLLASTLRTDQVSNIITTASPSQKGSEKVEEAIKPFNEGFVSPTPKVQKPESLKKISDFVQNTSVPGKSVEKSLSNVNDGKSVYHVEEMSLVSCTNEKMVKVNDAVTGISEGVDSDEGKVVMHQKVKDAVRSLVEDNMPDNTAGATNVLSSEVDGVLGVIEEESWVVKTVISDSNISTNYSGEKLGSEENAVAAEVENVKDYVAIEKLEIQTEFGGNEPSESKVEEGGPEYMVESHQLSEKGVTVGKPKFSEESMNLRAIEKEKRDLVGGQLDVTEVTKTEIGDVKELLVGPGQKQEMVECSKKEEFGEKDCWNVEGFDEATERKDGHTEGVSGKTKRRDDPAAVGTLDGVEAKTFANVPKMCDGLTSEAAERQGSEVLEGATEATIDITQTAEEFHVKQCLKQGEEVFQQASEPERREHADEAVYATEAPDTKIEQRQTEILVEQSLAQPKVVKIFEKDEKVFEEMFHNERMEHHEGSEIPKVQKPESLENVSDFVQNTSVLGKSVEESFSDVDDNKSVHYLGENSLASCSNEKVLKVTDAMTEINEGVDSNEGKEVMDQKVKEDVRSSRVENMPDNAANATDVLNGEVDGVLGIIEEESLVVKALVSDSSEYSGEKFGSEVNAAVAIVYNVKDFAVVEKLEVKTEFGVEETSESKVEEGSSEYMEGSHQLSEKGVKLGSMPNSLEEIISLGAIENDKRDHVGILHVTKVTITEIGEVKESLVGLGQKQAMVECSKKEEYREKDCQNVDGVAETTERRDGPTEGVSETTKRRDDLVAVGTFGGEEAKPFANVKKICDGSSSEAVELQGSEVLEGITDAIIKLTQTAEEFCVKQCLKQGEEVFQQASEPERREHADESVFAPDTKIEQRQTEIVVEQSLDQPEVFEDTVHNERIEHHEGTQTPKVQETEHGGKVLENVSKSKVEVGQTLNEHLVQQHQPQSKEETEASELLEVLHEEVVHDGTSEQEDIEVTQAICETADVSQTMAVLPPELCQTQAEEAKPLKEVEEFLLGVNAHDKNLQQTNTVLHAEATVEIGKRTEELLTEQYKTRAAEVFMPSEIAEVLQEAVGQAIVTSACIEQKAEPVESSDSGEKHEVKDRDKVEAFEKVIELDKREEDGGAVANISLETTDITGEKKQEGLMEHQTEVSEAEKHNKVEDVSQDGTKNEGKEEEIENVSQEGTKTEGMAQEVGPTLTSVEKLTEELILPDQVQEKEGAIGSSEDLEKGIDDA